MSQRGTKEIQIPISHADDRTFKNAIPITFPRDLCMQWLKDMRRRNAWECLGPTSQQRMGDEKMISCLLGIVLISIDDS